MLAQKFANLYQNRMKLRISAFFLIKNLHLYFFLILIVKDCLANTGQSFLIIR